MPKEIGFFLYYQGVWKSIKTYWSYYGGWSALYRSPYLHFAVLLSLLSFPIWTPEEGQNSWYKMAISVLPNLLGFTLVGFAILLAFGNEQFVSRISGEGGGGKPSPYLKLCGSFAHFIIVQIVALMIAFLGNARSVDNLAASFVGLAAFYYAISTTLMATLAVLNMSKWFDMFSTIKKEEEEESNEYRVIITIRESDSMHSETEVDDDPSNSIQ